MSVLGVSAFFLAFIWGVIWALTIQYIPFAVYLAQKRTWMTVVAGVGVDLAIGLLTVPDAPNTFWMWAYQFIIVALSSVGIITRSLVNEWHEQKEIINAAQDTR